MKIMEPIVSETIFNQIQIDLNKFDWSGVSGLSDALMVILTILMLIGLRQGTKSIRESALSRDAQVLEWAMGVMQQCKPDIACVTKAHQERPFVLHGHEWSEDELQSAQNVSVVLQRLGYLALNNLIAREHFMNLWGPMYLSCWYALAPWIKKRRIDLKESPDLENGGFFRMHLEAYAVYCEKNLPLQLVNNERTRSGLLPLHHSARPERIMGFVRNIFKGRRP